MFVKHDFHFFLDTARFLGYTKDRKVVIHTNGTIGDRVRDVRKTLSLTQKELSNALKMSENYVWQIEKGQRIPSDRTLDLICDKFSVNPVWLKTGIGEPFAPQSRESRITDILSKAIDGASTSRDRLIRALARLPDDAFPLIEQYILEAAENIQAEKKE